MSPEVYRLRPGEVNPRVEWVKPEILKFSESWHRVYASRDLATRHVLAVRNAQTRHLQNA
jgi:hypothetical protein